MAIQDDWTISYTTKSIYHSSGTTVYSVNEFYSWLMDVFDESSTIDDKIPMTAQTPTAYTLTNGWYLNYNYYLSHRFLYFGSLQTSGWDGTTNADGIRLLTFDASGYVNCVASDIGKVVVSGTHSGILLDYNNTLRHWWVRQDALDDTFISGLAVTITSGTGAGTTSQNSPTGNNIWSNPFSIGTLQANTQLYLYQNGIRIEPWWTTGHIDILSLVREVGSYIDEGYITFFARQYTKLYDHYLADLSDGSRRPIPLATFIDNNNDTGYRTAFTDTTTGFATGDIIYNQSDSTIRAIVTAVNSSPASLTYYHHQYPYTDFSVSNVITNGTVTATVSSLSDAGPADSLGITINFGSYSEDLNNGNGAKPYDCTIDVNQNSLHDLYEYLKYITRGGSALSLNSVPGEAYISADGSYDPAKQSPFGTFAGGKFFGARGIWLTNIAALDANNYELIDSNGDTQRPPATVALTVNSVEAGDRVSIFQTIGDSEIIDRNQFSSHDTNNTLGANTFEVLEMIPTDTPTSGVLRVFDDSRNNETRYAYTGWSGSTFTGLSPTLVTTYGTGDVAFVPYLETVASGNSVSQSLTYVADRYVLTVVRAAGIQPFKVKGQITSSGLTVAAIRNPDSVYV